MNGPTYGHPGVICTDNVISVPLDHHHPDQRQIEVFAREVVAADRRSSTLPMLLWLQGGPGGRAERPAPTSGWLNRALRDYRVILLDQRGTGRSTPANRQTLAGLSAAEQADYLTHFRADSIVRDAELLRRALIGDRPWSVLGQSFGGFCALSYLSLAPEGLAEVLITGGLASLTATADDVYRAAYGRVRAKNDKFFARYPDDVALARRVADYVREHEVWMPTGERLSFRRFQSLGITFGTTSRFDSLHYLLEEAFLTGPGGPQLSDVFLRGVDAAVSFGDRPLYAVLHEPIYAQHAASNWAAERIYAERPEFHADAAGSVLFTGEMIYPFQFEEDPALTPLRGAAHRLAAKSDWPMLYDLDQLANTTVPVVAAVYHDDMYVDRQQSLETAAAIRGLRSWVTNEFEHDGIRQGSVVLDRLLAMLHGMI